MYGHAHQPPAAPWGLLLPGPAAQGWVQAACTLFPAFPSLSSLSVTLFLLPAEDSHSPPSPTDATCSSTKWKPTCSAFANRRLMRLLIAELDGKGWWWVSCTQWTLVTWSQTILRNNDKSASSGLIDVVPTQLPRKHKGDTSRSEHSLWNQPEPGWNSAPTSTSCLVLGKLSSGTKSLF